MLWTSRLLAWKQSLEEMLSSGRSGIAAFVVELTTRPSVLASATFSFPMTFTGRKLDARYEWMTLSILPSGNAGFAVFTWNKCAPKNPFLFVKSFKAIEPRLQSTALLNLVLEVTENIYLAPDWWSSLPQQVQAALLARFSRSLMTGEPAPPAGWLLPKAPLVDWRIANSFYV